MKRILIFMAGKISCLFGSHSWLKIQTARKCMRCDTRQIWWRSHVDQWWEDCSSEEYRDRMRLDSIT